MKNWLATCLVGAFALALPGVAQAQKTKVTVYTALENDQLAPFKASIEKAVPEAEVVWVRDSTGVITARFLAEKDNPRADMVMGLAASSLLMFEKAGLLEAYKPNGADALKPVFRDGNEPYTWTGMDAYLGVVCFNTAEAKGVAVPTSWKDLLNPALKGKIVMPHPASSGTGYLMVAGWLQSMGEAEGWKFMDGLHENIAAYLHSGSAPCVQAARGERTVGLALDMRGASEKSKGAPIEVVIPKEGVGWEMEASAIVKGSKNLGVAKKIADWSTTKEANELYSKTYAIVAARGVENKPANYPANAEAGMIRNDLSWMADNRDRVLAEWSKRYESKAAPKN
ncbi:putative 2-aminoethylphosphonate ABC transporter substrate-binding protein [Bosea sp. (in: a-proteobacteria)]|jgi:iron(III) transport system substrate-binding protein|uniref:putative 2-aminoethylphosphonate ABC transporter substrate-binding protein n=1 Tax=Bosea sp. (in: a-proteobacteria) TaxID=1871050 RepID=UPI002DDD1192|nr:putative 2-aminoethylphosphonate ABC transporter substrate-binding protein [Bosea sp. (in: a-proteobacteria)]HEV2511500.1 putative 2-aminoethylphosphonate ABC transporter substrate-binding protein [Bosea sp. (in: a-proteobacteria)]